MLSNEGSSARGRGNFGRTRVCWQARAATATRTFPGPPRAFGSLYSLKSMKTENKSHRPEKCYTVTIRPNERTLTTGVSFVSFNNLYESIIRQLLQDGSCLEYEPGNSRLVYFAISSSLAHSLYMRVKKSVPYYYIPCLPVCDFFLITKYIVVLRHRPPRTYPSSLYESWLVRKLYNCTGYR